ncbi:MAG: ribosome biogenesis GTP-binding protein YihA/YsxC [Bacillota bacterium]|jgi:GTP-binding protein
MSNRQAQFVLSGVRPDQYPNSGLPEIALVGRSNVGKSSLINALLNRRNLARTSNTPGRTRTANFYLVDDQFYFVDLPGYGYAKISQVERRRWQRMLWDYLSQRQQLCLIVQVVDFRHPPTALDREMYAALRQLGTPKLVIANKIDKVNRSQWAAHQRQVLQGLAGLTPGRLVLLSAETKQGVGDVWNIISSVLAGTNS